MAARKILQLDEDSRTQLQRVVKRSGDWREHVDGCQVQNGQRVGG